ncbi:N-acetylmuramoyl-L-alanine amidase [Nocardia sp. NPDC056100]|uniref:N-acetylmuramoyl-L-alanine amidase n=1 Tax=Nocardia sp. NPDC056100 TaxID=3345712 RepID=UPI0035D57EB3
MKPNMVKAGIFTAVTAAAFSTVSGLIPGIVLASPVLPELPQRLAGKTIFLDPGHQGPNHSQDVAKQVDDGRGGTKACQTTGMTSLHGVPEHTINWDVAQLVRTSLEGLGARVVMSRPDDTGWGGCVDERARAANQSGADIAVSIHADSAPADARGFHLIVPQLPIPDAKANEVQSVAGLAASKAMRDAYIQAGFPAAAYNGAVEGLQPRSDIAGPALTQVPDVFLEMGNGANAEDAALLESQEGQLRHAVTITTGVVSYLLGMPVPPPSADQVVGPANVPPAQPAQHQLPAAPGTEPQTEPGGTQAEPQAVPQGGPGANSPQGGAQSPGAMPGGLPEPSGPAAGGPEPVAPQGVPAAPQVAPQGAAPAEVAPGTAPAPQAAPAPDAKPAPGGVQPAPQAPGAAPQPQSQGGAVDPKTQPGTPAPQGFSPELLFPQLSDLLKPQVAQPGQSKPAAPAPGVAQPNSVVPNQQPAADSRVLPATIPGASELPRANVMTGVQPVAAPIAPKAPPAAAPQPPSAGTQTSPGIRTSPGTLPNPGTPGTQSPSTDRSSKTGELFDTESMSGLVQSVIKLVGPLAKMLMGQNGVASDLINLAYSMVSALSSTILSAPAK